MRARLPECIDCGLCLLRPWQREDRSALIRHADNENVWRNLRDVFPRPYTAADADAWLRTAAATPPPPGLYAIDVGSEAVGGASLLRHDDVRRHCMELGYWLGEAYWGRGIMTAVARTLATMALAQPDTWRVEAPVLGWNAASMRVLEKAGFRREGILLRSALKDGTLTDQVLYAVTRDPGLPYVPATAP